MKKYSLLLILVMLLSAVSLTGCKKNNKISAPSNISIDEDNNLIWDAVDEAKSYNISFYFLDDGTTSTDYTRKTTYSLDNLAEGDYEISVQSVSGDKSLKDSNYSEAMKYHKYYATGCVYTLINNKTEYAITKVGKATGAFVIEDEYRGKAVTEISDGAFKGSTRVTGITIGSNVESLGDNAFYNCSKLESIVIPTSVRSMGTACFQSCRALKSVVIPSSITKINDYTFAYCRSLESAVIGENVASLGESAFSDCSALTEITIPDTVTSIGTYCFSGCTSLVKLSLGSGLTAVPDYAFYKCSALTELNFSDNSNITSIGEYTFADCSSLATVTIPDGVTDLGSESFYNDTALETITIPESVSHVGSYAFQLTKSFDTQYNDEENVTGFVYIDNWLVACKKEVQDALTKIDTETLKNTIVGVADSTFASSPLLESVVLPISFKYIGKYAFYGCPNLNKLQTLDNGISLIDDYAFANCGMTNLRFGIGLETIGNYAFANNTNLDNNALTPTSWIPETVTRIGTYAFKGTKLYTSVKTGAIMASNWVVGYAGTPTSIELDFDDDVSVAGIADYAFYKCESLQSVTGLSDAKYIGKGAFMYCSALVSATLNRSLKTIEAFAFYGDTALVNISLPRTLTKVGNYAFYGCTWLTDVNFTSTSCTEIGTSAFYGCSGLKEVKFDSKLETIGNYAFYKCTALETLELPDSLTSLGVKSFYKNTALTSISFGSGLSNISDTCFGGCESLESIDLPSNITSLSRNAFYNCTAVETINFSEGLTTIGDYAFYNLSEVEEIHFPSSLTEIGNYAFKGFNSLSTIIIPQTIKIIGQHAFYGCKNATIYTDAVSILGEWHERFNSSFRPIFWGVTFDENDMVTSIKFVTGSYDNIHLGVEINVPTPEDKTFLYWKDADNNEYTNADLLALNKELTLTPVFGD